MQARWIRITGVWSSGSSRRCGLSATCDRSVQLELSDSELKVSVSPGQGQGWIFPGENGRVGSLALSGGADGRFGDLDVQFKIDAVDVVCY